MVPAGDPLGDAAGPETGAVQPSRTAMPPVGAGLELASEGQGQTARPTVSTPAQVDHGSVAAADGAEGQNEARPIRHVGAHVGAATTSAERAATAATTAAGGRPPAGLASAPELRAARVVVEGPDLAADPSAEGVDGLSSRAARPAADSLGPARIASPGAQIGLQIAKAVPGRVAKMMVQLEPAQLGRVEVRLEFGQDNRLTALMIAAERPETLEALQRDTRALERSLEAAGLRLDDQSLSFSLADQDPRGEHMARQHRPFGQAMGRAAGAPAAPAEPEPDTNRWVGGLGLLDIRV
jgi:flagellar hook-length control protein FliK